MAAILSLFVIFLFLPVARQDSTQHSLAAVLRALEKLMQFYKSDYRSLNIDGLYGLRVLEGHTGSLIQEHARGHLPHLSDDVITRLKNINSQATSVSMLADEYVRQDNEVYYNMMKFVIGGPWDLFSDQRNRVDYNQEWNQDVYKHVKVKLDEQLSDHCMSELIGSSQTDGTKCAVSDRCVEVMTIPGMIGYGITHQILWTMMAEKAGCLSQVEKLLVENHSHTLADVRHYLCSNNYIQMKKTLLAFRQKKILPRFQDLFLEELFACPSLGYHDFLSIDYLPQVISWQFQNGCYGLMPRPSPADTKGVKLRFVEEEHDEGDDYDYLDDEDGAKDVQGEVHKFVQGVQIFDNPGEEKQTAVALDKNNTKGPLLADGVKPLSNSTKQKSVETTNVQTIADEQKKIAEDAKVVVKTGSDVKNVSAVQDLNRQIHKDNGNVNMPQQSEISKKQDHSSLKFAHQGNIEKKSDHLQSATAKPKSLINQSNEKLVAEPGGLRKLLHVNDGSNFMPIHQGRKLLVEKSMGGGCLAHKTAVAAGALSMYLRYLCAEDAASLFNRSRDVRSAEFIQGAPAPQSIKTSAAENGVHNVDTGGQFVGQPPLPHIDPGLGNSLHVQNAGLHRRETPIPPPVGGIVQDTENNGHQMVSPVQGNNGGVDNGDDDGDDGDDFDSQQYDGDEDGEENGNYYADNTNIPVGKPPLGAGAGVGQLVGNPHNVNQGAQLYPNHRVNGAQYPDQKEDDNYDGDDDDEDDGDGDYNEDDDDDYADDYKDDKLDDRHVHPDQLGKKDHSNDNTVKGADFQKADDISHDSVYRNKDKKKGSQHEEYSYYDDYKSRTDVKKDAAFRAQDGDFKLSGGQQELYRSSARNKLIKDKEFSVKGLVFMFAVCFAAMLLLMYRFIRKRRVHIRYNSRKAFGI